MNPVTAESCKGKHDYQLQKELDQEFNDRLINAHSSFERRRGRIVIVCDQDERERVKELLAEKHPEFKFSRDDDPQGRTRFLEFREVINL